jgi:hypothetical protein
MWYVSAALFILLSPGFLVTLPPVRKGGLWMSGQTSVTSVLVHAVIFVLVGNFVWNYIQSQKSGFQNNPSMPPNPNTPASTSGPLPMASTGAFGIPMPKRN